ncbi:nuclear transport factor 2 family protein [Chelatococcus reniformis]|uniref:Polyketide cyclase n=1 Tax=Chelatococcus reniformis TaxID=1494448 RepID=A0A916UP79_9HYPH|nr:nuclear transport factor 2 family protein [Chelatococcus reniformis]GGC81211.1 polyketide cyclase [Chelatococcus reniformis]
MSLDLPAPVAAYFAADKVADGAIAMCFTDEAVVKDEGHAHAGRAAIAKWRTEASVRYSYTSDPVAVAVEPARVVVTSRVTGNFPGSPVDLRYVFVLAGDKIASLEIAP